MRRKLRLLSIPYFSYSAASLSTFTSDSGQTVSCRDADHHRAPQHSGGRQAVALFYVVQDRFQLGRIG